MKLVCTVSDSVAVTPEVLVRYTIAAEAAEKIVRSIDELAPTHLQVLEEFHCEVGRFNLSSHDWELGSTFTLKVKLAGVERVYTRECVQFGRKILKPTADEIALAFVAWDFDGTTQVPYSRSVVSTLLRHAIDFVRADAASVEKIATQLEVGDVLKVSQ